MKNPVGIFDRSKYIDQNVTSNHLQKFYNHSSYFRGSCVTDSFFYDPTHFKGTVIKKSTNQKFKKKKSH